MYLQSKNFVNTMEQTLSTADFSPLFMGHNNPVSKILRFTDKFIDINIPYAMKLCQ
jgi:hypothetical protein